MNMESRTGQAEKMMFPIVNDYKEQSRIFLVVSDDFVYPYGVYYKKHHLLRMSRTAFHI